MQLGCQQLVVGEASESPIPCQCRIDLDLTHVCKDMLPPGTSHYALLISDVGGNVL